MFRLFSISTILFMALGNPILLAAPATTHTTSTNVVLAPYYLDANAGVLVGGGDGLPGVDVRLNGRLNTEVPLYFGGEVGLFFFSNYAASGAVIPILGNLTTVFNSNRRIRPLLGASVGPVISTGSGYSTARFALLINPGVNFDLSREFSMNVLARFGVIGSTFVALPEVGLSFAI